MSGTAPARPPAEAFAAGDELSLVDALDRLLEVGVVVEGDVVLSVADVDLVWLGLRAVLGDARHAPAGARIDRRASQLPGTRSRPGAPVSGRAVGSSAPPGGRSAERRRAVRATHDRVDFDENRTEQGLVKLVLSVVELLRQLMERQAMRRVDDPDLDDEQIERLGCALLRLEERMDDLKAFFGLHDDDLELRLGRVVDEEPQGM